MNCLICDEQLVSSSVLCTPCGHYYCRDCVKELVQAFTRDESLYPLRCCQQPIPTGDVVPFITLSLKKLFDTKHAEFSVLSKDRIYCCNPTCSAFLGSSIGKEQQAGVICTAMGCSTSTCPRCKEAAHPNYSDCTENKSTIALRALARTEGWQTCPRCHTLIELDLGCYHMTCRCRTQFCYLCAVPWKGCLCPQWEERRLLETAEMRVENQFGARANVMRTAAPAQFRQRVRQVVERLRENHDCDRHNWKYRPGGGRCEECHFMLPTYLLVSGFTHSILNCMFDNV